MQELPIEITRRLTLKMNKFWNFTDKNSERELHLNGTIAEETWWGDEVTPAAFKADLQSGNIR